MTAGKDGRPNIWNSLEIFKAASSILTPLAVLFLGGIIWSGQRDVVQHWEVRQAEQRKVIEADARERERLRDIRFSIHREVAPLLNDIFSYHFYVGSWKELSPADIITKKRKLNSVMYSNMPLFTPAFFKLYYAFMAQSFRGAGNRWANRASGRTSNAEALISKMPPSAGRITSRTKTIERMFALPTRP